MRICSQVAHDIRSPLVALKTLSKRVDGIAPDQRELLKASVNRIDSIATDLLGRFKDSIGVGDSSDICFAAMVVESIVAEKRSAMRSGCDYEIRCEISTEASLALVKLTRSDLSRVLSNLINNAIESLSFENSGLIEIRMAVFGSLLVTEIID